MKHLTTIMWLALLAAGPGHAQVGDPATSAVQVASATPLAAGEVLLQISAQGSVSSAPDRITVTVLLSAAGATSSAARAAAQAKANKVTAALVAAGIPADAISQGPGTSLGFMGDVQLEGLANTLPQVVTGSGTELAMTKRSTTSLLIRLSNVGMVARVNSVLDAQDEAMAGRPTMELLKDAPARQAAIADAIKKARADADAYATALGMQVVRFVRVSNQAANAFDSAAQMVEMFSNRRNSIENVVTTDAGVWIDFILAPR